ncbi:GLPGLI family protein [Zunongwangia endophytica]|uniref:GLPGLI family protein n=1 Tax=Zunongwangia endophytica TaxID=1808945 RepID=A0ABV8H7A7_9FLAO|nr:GLPGLI family protein [Zunongwangia endophytica]MDN3595792.1 GLPGLI family protein [Zunongwangia endophytica]
MKNLRCFLLICFFGFSLNAQSLEVVYGVSTELSLTKEQLEKIPAQIREDYKQSFTNLKHIKYILQIKNTTSLFKMQESMKNEALRGFAFTKVMAGFSGTYYNNYQKDIALNQVNAFGRDFIIRSKMKNMKWKLSKEQKTIKGFNVYKARGFETIKNNSGEHEIPIIAWYTPEINLPVGPANYGNLPGLILELERNKKTYTVESIEEKENIEIERPSKGKRVTQAEFEEIGAKVMKNLGN